jgi:hypothetical protein
MSDHLPARSMTFSDASRELSYQRLIADNGDVDVLTARSIAAVRATILHEALQRRDITRSWQECFDAELQQVLSDATDIRELRLSRQIVHALPLREQLIRSGEWEVDKARRGLGMPIDPDKIARLEEALERIKGQAVKP